MRFTKTIIFAGLTVGMVLPVAASASTITPPLHTVAISEKTYTELKSAHCYNEHAPKSAVKVSNSVLCDPVLARYENKIVMRVHARGELYKVNTKDGFGPLLKTYTQGIYKVGKEYYYVNEGFAKKLSTKRPDVTALAMARGRNAGVKMITTAQFSQLFGRSGSKQEAAAAKATQQAYKGHFVVVSDDHGKMYYVPTNIEDGENPVRVNKQFFTQLNAVSNGMSAKALRSLAN